MTGSSTYTQMQQLNALAMGLCQDARLRLVPHEGKWKLDEITGTVYVSMQDLHVYGPSYCAGILAGELGSLYTGRHRLFEVRWPYQHSARMLLDRLDITRGEQWIQRRYSGTGQWIEEVHENMRPPKEARLFNTFCEAVVFRDERHTWPEPVQQALELTAEARAQYAAMIPEAFYLARLTFEQRAHYLSTALPRLREVGWPPSPNEQVIQTFAAEALALAEEEIFPAAFSCFDQDELALSEALKDLEENPLDQPGGMGADEASSWLSSKDIQKLLRDALKDGRDDKKDDASDCKEGRQASSSDTEQALRRAAHRRELRRLLEMANARSEGTRPRLVSTSLRIGQSLARPASEDDFNPSDPRARLLLSEDELSRLTGQTPPTPKPAHQPPLNPYPEPEQIDEYEQVYRKMQSQINSLVRELEEHLVPRRRMKRSAGYPSGRQVNLKALMRFEADPRSYGKMWMRQSIPDRRDCSIAVAIDLSGSMRGEKTTAAVAGVTLIAETLSRMNVPFGLYGFQDVVIPLVPFGARFGLQGKQSIAEISREIAGDRPNGNNQPSYNDDGPCIEEIADHLLQQSTTDRVLIVISDGLPEGTRSSAEDLRTVISTLSADPRISLIALGLGPSTSHVEEYYPNAVANVPISEFSDEIGKVIQHTLRNNL